MLQKPITYMYHMYIILPLQGEHKHLASQSIHMDRIAMYTPEHLARHRSARWMKNYNNDDDAGEDRYICIYSLVIILLYSQT